MKNSVKTSVFTLIFTCLLFGYGIVNKGLAGEPFAPKVKVPKNMDNRDWWTETIQQWNVPDKKDVSIPPYPGAIIVKLTEGSEMTLNDEKIHGFPMIILGTVDEPTKVLAFYKEKLKDWNYMNEFSMFDVFWRDRTNFSSIDLRQSAVTEHIVIQESNKYGPMEMMPEAKTSIQIVYKPIQ